MRVNNQRTSMRPQPIRESISQVYIMSHDRFLHFLIICLIKYILDYKNYKNSRLNASVFSNSAFSKQSQRSRLSYIQNYPKYLDPSYKTPCLIIEEIHYCILTSLQTIHKQWDLHKPSPFNNNHLPLTSTFQYLQSAVIRYI